jgi:hypothetical protein
MRAMSADADWMLAKNKIQCSIAEISIENKEKCD